MCELVDEAIGAGALGFSTSRTLLHRVPDGRPVPGTWADERELLAIADVLGRHGAGVYEVAPRFERPGDELREHTRRGALDGRDQPAHRPPRDVRSRAEQRRARALPQDPRARRRRGRSRRRAPAANDRARDRPAVRHAAPHVLRPRAGVGPRCSRSRSTTAWRRSTTTRDARSSSRRPTRTAAPRLVRRLRAHSRRRRLLRRSRARRSPPTRRRPASPIAEAFVRISRETRGPSAVQLSVPQPAHGRGRGAARPSPHGDRPRRFGRARRPHHGRLAAHLVLAALGARPGEVPDRGRDPAHDVRYRRPVRHRRPRDDPSGRVRRRQRDRSRRARALRARVRARLSRGRGPLRSAFRRISRNYRERRDVRRPTAYRPVRTQATRCVRRRSERRPNFRVRGPLPSAGLAHARREPIRRCTSNALRNSSRQSRDHAALSPRSRRRPWHLGARGARLPPLFHQWVDDRLGAGRVPRRRSVLRRQRLPHHVAAADRTTRERSCLVPTLLRSPGAPSPARVVDTARGRRCVFAALRARRNRRAQGRRPRRAHVHEQLVADSPAPFVLRERGTTRAPEEPVVARDRGAVLPDLAGRC